MTKPWQAGKQAGMAVSPLMTKPWQAGRQAGMVAGFIPNSAHPPPPPPTSKLLRVACTFPWPPLMGLSTRSLWQRGRMGRVQGQGGGVHIPLSCWQPGLAISHAGSLDREWDLTNCRCTSDPHLDHTS